MKKEFYSFAFFLPCSQETSLLTRKGIHSIGPLSHKVSSKVAETIYWASLILRAWMWNYTPPPTHTCIYVNKTGVVFYPVLCGRLFLVYLNQSRRAKKRGGQCQGDSSFPNAGLQDVPSLVSVPKEGEPTQRNGDFGTLHVHQCPVLKEIRSISHHLFFALQNLWQRSGTFFLFPVIHNVT